MMMLKTFLGSLLAGCALAASACWFTADTYEGSYIAGVNNYFAHYTPGSAYASAVYLSGQSAHLPLTVWIKVSPRQSGVPITRAVLQYKILPAGSWVTVKNIERVLWLDLAKPAAVFGRNNISPAVAAGTEILIRVYLTDGTFETGDLGTDISSGVPASASSALRYEGGWSPAFVMRIKVAGRRAAL